MSGPGGGGGRMKSSPKQGPLKATIPISSVTKEGSNLRKSTSPTMASPKFGQVVVDIGRNSPNTTTTTTHFDEKQCNIGSTIRRTASLDTIYLRGLFPKDAFYWHRDRSTQTEISNSLDSLQTTNSDANEKFSRLSVRARRRSVSRDSPNDQNTGTQTNLVQSIHPNKVNAPKSSRSSEEGLNQEIEGIILRSESDPQCNDRLRQPTPEGRKAPVADLLKFKISTNTQTLVGSLVSSEESQGSSPDQDRMNASPRINKFLEREPPDGCERVPLKKSVPIIIKPIPLQRVPQPQATNFTLKPSSGSAFETLIINKTEEGDEENVSPIVPAAATANTAAAAAAATAAQEDLIN